MSGVGTYIPNADDDTQPTDAVIAETAAAEFRALKSKVNNLSGVSATWNPVDKADSISLSNGNLLAIKTEFSNVFMNGGRATVGKSGNVIYYYENIIGTATGVISVGMATLTEDIADADGTFLGQTVASIGYQSNGKVYQSGVLAATVATYGFGDVIGVTFQANDSVVFSKNGVFQATVAWTAPIKPAAKYPAYDITNYGDYLVANFGATAFNFLPGVSYAIPFYSPPTFTSGVQNLIINGDIGQDQRNARAIQAAIATGSYMSDRWVYVASNAGQYSAQSVLSNINDLVNNGGNIAYQRMTVGAGFAVGAGDFFYAAQRLEGLRTAKLLYGHPAAKVTSLIFYARSSITGLHSGAITNAAGTRSFPFSFTIPTANTWQKVAIPLIGCVDGAWVLTEALAAEIRFNLGCGATGEQLYIGSWYNLNLVGATGAVSIVATAGATFDFTGVEWRIGQFAVNSLPELIDPVAELLDCQRYYSKVAVRNTGNGGAGVGEMQMLLLPTAMRVVPAVTISANANTNCGASAGAGVTTQVATVSTVVVAGGGFIQSCTAEMVAEL